MTEVSRQDAQAPISCMLRACTSAGLHTDIAMIQSVLLRFYDDEAFCGEESMRNLG